MREKKSRKSTLKFTKKRLENWKSWANFEEWRSGYSKHERHILYSCTGVVSWGVFFGIVYERAVAKKALLFFLCDVLRYIHSVLTLHSSKKPPSSGHRRCRLFSMPVTCSPSSIAPWRTVLSSVGLEMIWRVKMARCTAFNENPRATSSDTTDTKCCMSVLHGRTDIRWACHHVRSSRQSHLATVKMARCTAFNENTRATFSDTTDTKCCMSVLHGRTDIGWACHHVRSSRVNRILRRVVLHERSGVFRNGLQHQLSCKSFFVFRMADSRVGVVAALRRIHWN